MPQEHLSFIKWVSLSRPNFNCTVLSFVFFVLHYVPCTLHFTICNCGSLHYKPWLLWDSFCNFWVCICDFYFVCHCDCNKQPTLYKNCFRKSPHTFNNWFHKRISIIFAHVFYGLHIVYRIYQRLHHVELVSLISFLTCLICFMSPVCVTNSVNAYSADLSFNNKQTKTNLRWRWNAHQLAQWFIVEHCCSDNLYIYTMCRPTYIVSCWSTSVHKKGLVGLCVCCLYESEDWRSMVRWW